MTSLNPQKIKLVAVLNITPDSFSDGGHYLDCARAVEKAREYISEGADIIDIGADSTRPGSKCVGAEIEWERLETALTKIVEFADVSVDTHQAEVARRAIKAGAKYINDVFSGYDPLMFSHVADSNAKIILTYTRCKVPHVFEPVSYTDIIASIKEFFEIRIGKAFAAGVKKEQIILDPGMGAFISEDTRDSYKLIDNFEKLLTLDFPFMLSASRKGFLKIEGEISPLERDLASAKIAKKLFDRMSREAPHYVRVHNVAIHRDMLR